MIIPVIAHNFFLPGKCRSVTTLLQRPVVVGRGFLLWRTDITAAEKIFRRRMLFSV
jgi:hypothetical protein